MVFWRLWGPIEFLVSCWYQSLLRFGNVVLQWLPLPSLTVWTASWLQYLARHYCYNCILTVNCKLFSLPAWQPATLPRCCVCYKMLVWLGDIWCLYHQLSCTVTNTTQFLYPPPPGVPLSSLSPPLTLWLSVGLYNSISRTPLIVHWMNLKMWKWNLNIECWMDHHGDI